MLLFDFKKKIQQQIFLKLFVGQKLFLLLFYYVWENNQIYIKNIFFMGKFLENSDFGTQRN